MGGACHLCFGLEKIIKFRIKCCEGSDSFQRGWKRRIRIKIIIQIFYYWRVIKNMSQSNIGHILLWYRVDCFSNLKCLWVKCWQSLLSLWGIFQRAKSAKFQLSCNLILFKMNSIWKELTISEFYSWVISYSPQSKMIFTPVVMGHHCYQKYKVSVQLYKYFMMLEIFISTQKICHKHQQGQIQIFTIRPSHSLVIWIDHFCFIVQKDLSKLESTRMELQKNQVNYIGMCIIFYHSNYFSSIWIENSYHLRVEYLNWWQVT